MALASRVCQTLCFNCHCDKRHAWVCHCVHVCVCLRPRYYRKHARACLSLCLCARACLSLCLCARACLSLCLCVRACLSLCLSLCLCARACLSLCLRVFQPPVRQEACQGLYKLCLGRASDGETGYSFLLPILASLLVSFQDAQSLKPAKRVGTGIRPVWSSRITLIKYPEYLFWSVMLH